MITRSSLLGRVYIGRENPCGKPHIHRLGDSWFVGCAIAVAWGPTIQAAWDHWEKLCGK